VAPARGGARRPVADDGAAEPLLRVAGGPAHGSSG